METKQYQLEKKYILEDEELCDFLTRTIEENQVTLIVSPQGTGKTEFIKSMEKVKLIMEPTVALSEQLQDEGFNRQSGIFETTFKITGINKYSHLIDQDYTTTFMSSVGIINTSLLEEYDILFVDEIHKIVQYSDFSYKQVIMALDTIKSFIELGRKVVLLTATPNLLSCLADTFLYNKINIHININSERQYLKSCYIINNLMNEYNIETLIKLNTKDDNFQIALINNTELIEKIAYKLNENGIKALSVNSIEYKKNINGKADLIKAIKNSSYNGYKALLATSFLDVGLNFNGSNITHIYCVFDNYYNVGDFTIIRQFIARTRNSTPILYLNRPMLTENEYALASVYSLFKNPCIYESVYNDLKEIANEMISNYVEGKIIDLDVKKIYGIYKNYEECERKDRYKFSNITLKYQLSKLSDKILYEIDENYISKLLNINVLEELESIDSKILPVINTIKEYLITLANDGNYIPMDIIREKIHSINGGIIPLSENFNLKNSIINKYFKDEFRLESKRIRIAGKPNPINGYLVLKL